MIVITDWVADIPEEERHIAYVGENETTTREFLLADMAFSDWTFHLDLAFDLTTVTVTGEPHDVEEISQHTTEAATEEQVTVEHSQSKDRYIRTETVVDCAYPTDVAYLNKSLEPDGIHLRWVVLAQHTRLPGVLRAVIRAHSAQGEVKKTAVMHFAVGSSVEATPAAPVSVSEFQQMEQRMAELLDDADAVVSAAAASAQQAAASASQAADFEGEAGTSSTIASNAASQATQAAGQAAADAARVTAAVSEAENYATAASNKMRTAAHYAELAVSNAAAAAQSSASAADALTAIAGYSAHPPVIGEDGKWKLWDGTAYAGTDHQALGESGLPEVVQVPAANAIATYYSNKEYRFGSVQSPITVAGLVNSDETRGAIWSIQFTKAGEAFYLSYPPGLFEWFAAEPSFTTGMTYQLIFLPVGNKKVCVWMEVAA